MHRKRIVIGIAMVLLWLVVLRADAYEWTDEGDGGPAADELPWNTMVRSPRVVSEEPLIIQPACAHGHCDTALRIRHGDETSGAYWRLPWASSGSTAMQVTVDGQPAVLQVSEATYAPRSIAFDVAWLAAGLLLVRLGLGDRHAGAGAMVMAVTAPVWLGYASLWFFVVGAIGIAAVIAMLGLGLRLAAPGRPRAQAVAQAIMEVGLLLVPLAWALGPYLASGPTH